MQHGWIRLGLATMIMGGLGCVSHAPSSSLGDATAAGTVLTGDSVQVGPFVLYPSMTVVQAHSPAIVTPSVRVVEAQADTATFTTGETPCDAWAEFYATADRSGTPVWTTLMLPNNEAGGCTLAAHYVPMALGDSIVIPSPLYVDTIAAANLPAGHYYVSLVFSDQHDNTHAVAGGEVTIGN